MPDSVQANDEYRRNMEALAHAGFRYCPGTDRWLRARNGQTVWVANEFVRQYTYDCLRMNLAKEYLVELPWVPSRD